MRSGRCGSFSAQKTTNISADPSRCGLVCRIQNPNFGNAKSKLENPKWPCLGLPKKERRLNQSKIQTADFRFWPSAPPRPCWSALARKYTIIHPISSNPNGKSIQISSYAPLFSPVNWATDVSNRSAAGRSLASNREGLGSLDNLGNIRQIWQCLCIYCGRIDLLTSNIISLIKLST